MAEEAALLGQLAAEAGSASEEVVTFLLENDIDERGTKAMMEISAEAQKQVMARGSLKDTRNPSSALLSRIRDAAVSAEGGGGEAPDPEAVELFILENAVDESAAVALRGCPGDVQRVVLERGSLADATNPSGALMARLKWARQKGQKRPAAGGNGGWGAAAGGVAAWGAAAAEVDPERVAKLAFAKVPQDFPLVIQGYPDSAPVVVHDKKDPVFSVASTVIGEFIETENFELEVEVVHDEEWETFPQLGEALKVATDDEHMFAVFVHSTTGKWAIGAAPGKRGREAAGKLALAVALCSDDPGKLNTLAQTYPDFGRLLASGGLVKAPASTRVAKITKPVGAWGGGAAAWGGPQVVSGAAPNVYWLQLQGFSGLMQQGYPADGPALLYDKAYAQTFSSATHVLSELVDSKADYTIEHDPEWTTFPDVAAACAAAGAEEDCIAVAICPSRGVWAAGIGSGWKTRENAAKLALALSLAYVSGRMQELATNYPEFGQVLAASEGGSAAAPGWGASKKKAKKW